MAGGADLRSTRGERVIVRQVSTVPVATDAILAAEVSGEPVIEPYSPQELNLATDSYVYEPSSIGEYGQHPPRWSDGYWVEAEFLLWWRKDRRFPPPVTRADPAFPGPVPGTANALNLAEGTVVFGGAPIEEHAQPGGRMDFGLWLDEYRNFGIGGRFVAVGDSPVSFAGASNGIDIGIGRPYYDPNFTSGTSDVAIEVAGGGNAARTNASSGWINVDSDSEVMAGDLYYRLLMHQNGRMRTDFVFGYQFGRIFEDVIINSFSQRGPVPPGLPSIALGDVFAATNEFHGGHFGLQSEYRYGSWGLEVLAKFAFGSMRETVLVNGSSAVDTGGGPTPGASGLLAQRTNIGEHVQHEFAFMEDIGVKVAYYPFERLKISAGYSLMYWSSAVRPGDHIDFGVDGRLLLNPDDPVPVRPAFAFRPVGFYLHGVNLGMEYRF